MHTRIAYLLVILLLLGGCSQVRQQWTNFSAYHNTFYNARLSFEEGVEAVEEPDPPIDRGVYAPVFGELHPVSNTEPFDDAVRRSADILRKHASSRWVEDALLIIGRSYFYMENYVGAEQKFEEVLALEASKREDAYFWLGRTLVEAGRYAEAIHAMDEALEQESLSREWMGRYYLVGGEAHLHQQSWEEAADAIERGARAVPERRLESRAWYLLGQIHETLELPTEAVAAYERAADRSFDFDLAYEARFSAIRTSVSAGEGAGEALQQVLRMERQQQYADHRAELAYVAGSVYQATGRHEPAIERYRSVLGAYETITDNLRGRVHHALAELYEQEEDFLLAAAHYDTAATALGNPSDNPSTSVPFTPGLVPDADTQHRNFEQYAEAQHEVLRLDSLLHLGSMSDEEFNQFVQALQEEQMRDQEAEHDQSEGQRTSWDTYDDEELLDEASSTDVSDDEPGSAGFLFHRDASRVQEGRTAFTRRWGERQRVPNWRRRAAASTLQARTIPQQDAVGIEGDDAFEEGEELSGVVESGDDAPAVDVSEVPRDAQSQAQLRERRTQVLLDAANALFIALERPDSAAVIYQQVVEEDPTHEAAIRARYALAETHRARGNMTEAQHLYRDVVEQHPDTDFAVRAREFLGEASAPSEPAESEAEADLKYQEAYQQWEQGELVSALGAMLVLAERYRETDVAPRALFAAGRIFRDWADREDIDPLPRLSEAVPNHVLEEAGFDTNALTVEEQDTLLAVGTLLEGGPARGPSIDEVYRRIVERYPEALQVDQARAVLAMLEHGGPAPESDAVAEHTDVEEEIEVVEENILPGPVEEDTFTTEIEWQAGDWTVTIVSWPEEHHARESAQTFRQRLNGADHEIDVLELEDEGGTPRFYVGIGQFATEEEAEDILTSFESILPEQARVVQVPE